MQTNRRILIVNADDANLTPGVTEAILKCHEQGIVSSTTWLVNLPTNPSWIRRLLKRKSLGIGLHLNVTLGPSVTAPHRIHSLVDSRGNFKRKSQQLSRLPKAKEVKLEYQNQIRQFMKVFGKMPTHLDTHHQMHDHPFYFQILSEIAHRHDLPIRRSRLMSSLKRGRVKTTDFWFGNLNPGGHWTRDSLESIVQNAPRGLSEIMCHPGRDDKMLRRISSFCEGRVAEFRLFRSKDHNQAQDFPEQFLRHRHLG